MSQPSLSSQVKVLESVLDRRLFRKVGRNMRLTGEGERVFEYCRRMFSTAEELERSLRDSGRAGVAQLRIGVTEQIERPFVADILSHLLREPGQPHPGLKIVSGEKDSLLDQLRAQQIDLALTNSPAYGTEFMEVASFDMPVGLVISRQLYRDQEKRLREIPRLKSWMIESKLGLVLPSEKMKLRHETDQYLQKHAVRPPVTLESDVLSLVVRAVVDGAGMGFLPLAYLGEELRQGSVVPIFTGRTFWSHQFRMIVRKRETLDPQIKAMIASANAVKGSFTSPQ